MAVLLTACSGDDSPDALTTGAETAAIPVTGITAMLADSDDGTVTRATYGGTWAGSENVAVAMKTPVGTTYTTKNYTTTAAGVLSPKDASNTLYWVSYAGNHTVKAWYFGDGTYYSSCAKSWTVSTTQTTATLQSNDFIYAPATTMKYSDATKKLTFHHQLVKVIVRVKRLAEGVDVTVNSVTMGNSNIVTKGTFAEPATNATDQNHGTWALSTTSTDKKTVTLASTADTDDYKEYTALIIPQTIANGTLFTVNTVMGSLTYTSSLTAEAGKQYLYTFNYTPYGLTVTSTVTPWDSTTAEETNSIYNVAHDN